MLSDVQLPHRCLRRKRVISHTMYSFIYVVIFIIISFIYVVIFIIILGIRVSDMVVEQSMEHGDQSN